MMGEPPRTASAAVASVSAGRLSAEKWTKGRSARTNARVIEVGELRESARPRSRRSRRAGATVSNTEAARADDERLRERQRPEPPPDSPEGEDEQERERRDDQRRRQDRGRHRTRRRRRSSARRSARSLLRAGQGLEPPVAGLERHDVGDHDRHAQRDARIPPRLMIVAGVPRPHAPRSPARRTSGERQSGG